MSKIKTGWRGGQLSAAAAIGLAALFAHSYAEAVPFVFNPSFEVDGDFPLGNGRIISNGPITAWTASRGDRVGINTGSQPFADNGAIPDGTHVAKIQHGPADGVTATTLTQTVNGFAPGHHYVLTYRENGRNEGGDPNAEVTLGGTTIIPAHTVTPVGGTNPYHTVSSDPFTATASSHDLVFATLPSTVDTTVLIDQVQIRPAHLLFSDNFNVYINSTNINPGPNDEPGRQGGIFAGLSYHDGGSDVNLVQVKNPTYPGSTLFLANAENAPPYTQTRTHVSPNHNFVDFGPAQFTIEFDMDPANPTLSGQDSHVDPLDWAAIVFGNSTQLGQVDTTDGVGFLIRKNNTWAMFDGTGSGATSRVEATGDLGTLGIDDQGFYHVRADYSVTAFDGTSPVSVSIYVDDLLVHSFTTDFGFIDNFMVLGSRGDNGSAQGLTSHAFDNLAIYTSRIPEPSTLALLFLGGLAPALFRGRRRR